MPAVTLPSRFNRIMAIVLGVLSILAVVAAATSGDLRLLPAYPGAALLAFVAWVALWRPYVRVEGEGVTLRNVTHSVLVPWAALIQVETRYALTLRTPRHAFAAWAAPAPGFLTALRARRRDGNREAQAAGDSRLRVGDLIGTESGDAALIVRERWRALVESGAVLGGTADDITVHRRWDAVVIGGLLALTALTVWALIATS